MHLTILKTFIWVSILLIAGVVIFLASSFLSRTGLQQSTIPPLLEFGNAQTEVQEIGCDPVVIVMDADGNVYSGKNLIGSMANPLELTTRLKEVIEARASRLAYTRGMDLNIELPLRCTNESVYIKAYCHANDSRILELIRALRQVGVNPTRLIIPKGGIMESPWQVIPIEELFSKPAKRMSATLRVRGQVFFRVRTS